MWQWGALGPEGLDFWVCLWPVWAQASETWGSPDPQLLSEFGKVASGSSFQCLRPQTVASPAGVLGPLAHQAGLGG